MGILTVIVIYPKFFQAFFDFFMSKSCINRYCIALKVLNRSLKDRASPLRFLHRFRKTYYIKELIDFQ